MTTDEAEINPEIAVTGDLTDRETEISDKLLSIPPGGECVLYFDSPGGSAYVGLAIMSLIKLRGLQATGVVSGECSSAALWPFAACKRRLVTRFSVSLFHPMRWQSEERVALAEADEWARHFRQLERDMDELLADLLDAPLDLIRGWMHPGRYVSGEEMAKAGLAELIPLDSLAEMRAPTTKKKQKRRT